MSDSRLSLCLIVRDAAADLPRCLASVHDLVDEIVAVDTGSTDDTIAVLQQWGAKVVQVPWENDFAKPRNVAIERATGDWILFLDADEALDEATRGNLRGLCIHSPDRVSYGILQRSFTSEDADPTRFEEHPITRLFNRREGHYYVGALHEQLMGSKPIDLPADTLCIWHWGYLPSRLEAKNARNTPIFQSLLSANAEAQLALTEAFATSEPALMRHHAEAVLRHFPRLGSISPMFAQLAGTRLIKSYVKAADHHGALRRAGTLQAAWPDIVAEPMFHLLVGQAYDGIGQTDEAEAAYRQAWQLGRLDPVQTMTDIPQAAYAGLSLATALARRHRLDEMIGVLREVRQQPTTPAPVAARAAAFLVPPLLANGRVDEAEAMAQAAVSQFPDERAELANQFLAVAAYVPALTLMTPLWDPDTRLRQVEALLAGVTDYHQRQAIHGWFVANLTAAAPAGDTRC